MSSCSTTFHWLEKTIDSNFSLCKMTNSNFKVAGRQISMYSTKDADHQNSVNYVRKKDVSI